MEASSKSHLKRRQSGKGRLEGDAGRWCVQGMTRTCTHTHTLWEHKQKDKQALFLSFSPPLFLALLLHSFTHAHTSTLGPLWFVLFYLTILNDPSTRDQYDLKTLFKDQAYFMLSIQKLHRPGFISTHHIDTCTLASAPSVFCGANPPSGNVCLPVMCCL